jgi:hypothetical protein
MLDFAVRRFGQPSLPALAQLRQIPAAIVDAYVECYRSSVVVCEEVIVTAQLDNHLAAQHE